MEVTIRHATHDDLDALLDLREAVAAEGIWIHAEAPLDREGDHAKHAATIDAHAGGTAAVLLVATLDDGTVVGGLSLQNHAGLAGLGMNVADGHRGLGIGRALLEAGIEWARRAGVHKIELQHWPWNLGGRALYERFGFVEEGYLRRQYRRRNGALWDVAVMGLVLDATAPGHEERANTAPPYP
jgi:RimJ/RimL family protein N-acetyltransferase